MRLEVIAFLLNVTFSFSTQASWYARRLEVHEWGVSEFDWSQGKTPKSDFPDFIYTDKSPGISLGVSTNRVKDMEADTGIRAWTKPVLYFYGPDTLRGQRQPRPIPVAVEVRFKDGQALAWWPQVNRYRMPEEVAKATEPDLEAWNQRRMEVFRASMKARLTPEEFQKAWSFYDGRKFMPNQLGFRARDFGFMPPFPDDERFQLIWDRLTLSGAIPEATKLKGEDLPDSNWVTIARQVDSDYVSNGRETEKFLFYEGKTPEAPAIALVPYPDPMMGRGLTFQVYNVSDHPVYDMFLVYRDKTQGRFWAQYQREVQPYHKRQDPAGPQSTPHLLYPMVPNFEAMGIESFIDETEFHRRTELLMSRVLVTEYPPPPDGGYVEYRNPALYQPTTTEYRLFPKELAALEQIWNQEFFGNDGLTIIYREATDYLDEAVPVHVFTDMHHYVCLSRCSLVVNRNVDPDRVAETYKQLDAALAKLGKEGKLNSAAQQALKNTFVKDRFGTLGLLAYYRLSGARRGAERQLGRALDLAQ